MRLFNRIVLQTPESVELEFLLAGIGSRALALLIDYQALALAILLFLLIWSFVAGQLVELAIQIFGSGNDIELWFLAITILVCFCIYVGYFVFFETLWQGQTPGKRWTKIRVIQDTGRTIGLQQAILRSLLRPFDEFFFFSVGAFMIMLGRQEKRLGDWVAGTIVVQEERPTAAATFATSESAQSLVNYLLQEGDLSQLLPDDFAVIREYLQRRDAMAPTARTELSLKLAQQAKTLIVLESIPSSITAEQFLEAVYLAYQQQSDSV